MKKIVVVFLAACLLFASSRYVSRAATSVPTVSWNLVPTAYMEQIGIFTDPVNHRGIYNYSQVTVTCGGGFWYSPYYYIAAADRHYYFCGYSNGMSSFGNPLYIRMQNKFTEHFVADVLDEDETYFIYDFGTQEYATSQLSHEAYFKLGVDSYYPWASVTLNGGLETY